MLRSIKAVDSYKVDASDGTIGKVTDFLFDDQRWTIRYLVTDTSGFWGNSHRVLISPRSFRSIDETAQLFHLALTKDKIRSSPHLDLDQPVTRQHERDHSDYYRLQYYWGPEKTPAPKPQPVKNPDDDPHLRSAKQVARYHVHASDGEIGHIADFIIDDESWTIRYLVVATSNWWLGKQVLVAPHWVQKVSWLEDMVHLDVAKDALRASPAWNSEALLNREYEERLYAHYGRHPYWTPANLKEQVGI